MQAILIALGKAAGQAALAALIAVVTGKTFKSLLLAPFALIAKKTKNTTDDKIVEEAREDLGLPKEEESK